MQRKAIGVEEVKHLRIHNNSDLELSGKHNANTQACVLRGVPYNQVVKRV